MLNFRHQFLVIAALGVCALTLAQDISPSPPSRPIGSPINGCLALTYPIIARKDEAEGATHVSLTVLPSGAVTDVTVSKASGASRAHQALDKAAVKAISGCVYAETPGFSARTGILQIVWQLEPAVTNSSNSDHEPQSSSERKSGGEPPGAAHPGR
ncbi:TonB family protein [Noviherbaspirillum sp.]|uniref:TonB family protein n=1 Tax=Noviherbaspirillum sp. TaxID=1926288 RepID=UPI003FA5DC30